MKKYDRLSPDNVLAREAQCPWHCTRTWGKTWTSRSVKCWSRPEIATEEPGNTSRMTWSALGMGTWPKGDVSYSVKKKTVDGILCYVWVDNEEVKFSFWRKDVLYRYDPMNCYKQEAFKGKILKICILSDISEYLPSNGKLIYQQLCVQQLSRVYR